MIDIKQIEDLLEEGISPTTSVETLRDFNESLANIDLQGQVRLVERIPAAAAAIVFRFLPKERAMWVFETLDAGHQANLLQALHEREVVSFFEQMDPDDRVDLLAEVPAKVAAKLIKGLGKHERDLTSVILGYPAESVGRRMSPEILRIRSDLTVNQAMEIVRTYAYQAETIYTLPIIDHQRHLVGVVSLRDLITSQPEMQLAEIMEEPVYAYADADAEETSRWFLPLALLAIPIVDREQRLVGILTADDAQVIVEQEDTEDSARGGGYEPLRQPYLSTPLWQIVRSRIVWLTILALSAVFTVHVLDIFQEELAVAVVLALFIPLITGTGGNTGNQAATTVTRALALGDVETSDIMRVIWREMRVGFGLGAALGSIGFTITTIFYGPHVGAVIGITLLVVCTMAASVGGIMPLIAKIVGADPAVFSNPFISTFCDASGLIIYFLIAKIILHI